MKNFKFSRLTNFIILFVLTVSFLTISMMGYAYANGKGIEENLFRLHVIANSDSAADQALKLKVRDRVLEYVSTRFGHAKDKREMMALVSNDLDNLNQDIRDYLKSIHENVDFKTEISKVVFPTREYGIFKIPPGTYDALRVILGKGEGKNWWCILFPPLCFADSAVVSKSDTPVTDQKALLKRNLTDEEYMLISQAKSDQAEVKFKFKIVEVFQDSKTKISMIKSNIF